MADKYAGTHDDDEVVALKAELATLVRSQREAEAAVEEAEEALRARQKALADIAEHQIPEVMDKLGKKRYLLPNGVVVALDEKIRASIPKALEGQAFDWLRSHGHGSLIKREVKCTFGRGEDEKAQALLQELRTKGLSAEDKTSVHAQTLGAFVREQLSEDKPVPLELFGVVQVRRAKIG